MLTIQVSTQLPIQLPIQSVTAMLIALLILSLTLPARINAETQPVSHPELQAAIDHGMRWTLTPNVPYLIADDRELTLDVLGPIDTDTKAPVLLYIHGGGWVIGDKDRVWPRLLPYSAMGLAIVNVSYRLARTALAPAAVEDTRCALRWLLRNGDKYGLDTSRIVLAGNSAGGHLSLTTGMLRAADGFDDRCPGDAAEGTRTDAVPREMPVAAIVNWYGITDVGDLLSGRNAKTYAINWFAGVNNRDALAARISPINLVHKQLPPILTIHGDDDRIVPYSHAQALHKQLNRANLKHELLTIEGGRHGRFNREQNQQAFSAIAAFLTNHGVLTAGGTP